MPEDHGPVGVEVVGVVLIVDATIESTEVADRVERSLECVVEIWVNRSTVSIIWVVKVGKTIVVVVPVDVVFETVSVNIRIDSIRAVVTVQSTVDGVKVSIIVEVTIPVNVKDIDDSIVVVVNVFPIENTITVPIVELGERSTAGLTSWIWVDRVWIGCCWTIPSNDVSCLIERETIVLIVDIVVIKVVLEVGCITANQNVT